MHVLFSIRLNDEESCGFIPKLLVRLLIMCQIQLTERLLQTLILGRLRFHGQSCALALSHFACHVVFQFLLLFLGDLGVHFERRKRVLEHRVGVSLTTLDLQIVRLGTHHLLGHLGYLKL